MARSYANYWSHAASALTSLAHTRASAFRWGVVIILTLIWIIGGLYYWRAEPWPEATYRTIGAVGMWDRYFNNEQAPDPQAALREIVRFAAIAAPVVGLIFAFSGQLGSSLARIFNLLAARHVVIAGASPAALSLALNCTTRNRDAVILIGQGLPEESALDLRRKGVIVLEGDATSSETLRTARAHYAAHVVAFEPDDTANLQTEACVRRLVGKARRRPPIGVHVYTRSPMLLRESREMRSAQARKQADAPQSVDSKPFSLDEVAARGLLQQETQTLLSLAEELRQDRVHIAMFGFDEAAEAFAAVVLKSLWSSRFQAPRITVMTPGPDEAEARFRARHREAFAYSGLWSADIAFMEFNWEAASLGAEVLDAVETARGKPTAAIVATGSDPANIHLAITLKRVCNHGLRWPIPIYMKESSESEFSKEYAKGDDTAELDAYLQAFGAHQITATRAKILDGALDRGAAIAHEHYNLNLGARDPMSMRELQAAMRDWSDVLETYRAANRAVSDSAMTKIWDAGWRAAKKGEKGDTAPTIPDDLLEGMAKREHDRWVAERLMSGWRPTAAGEARNNALMAHDKLVGWDALTEDDYARDRVQVRAAIDIARLMHPLGFLPRAKNGAPEAAPSA